MFFILLDKVLVFMVPLVLKFDFIIKNMNLLPFYLNYKKFFRFGLHCGLHLSENKDINFKKLGTYYHTYVIDFIFLQWFIIRLKNLIFSILKQSGNFFFLNACEVDFLSFLKLLNIPNIKFDFSSSEISGIISNKHVMVRLLFSNDPTFNWHIIESPSFVVLMTDVFGVDQKSLIIQAISKNLPVLCFSTVEFPYTGVYQIPNKEISTEFLFFWTHLILMFLNDKIK